MSSLYIFVFRTDFCTYVFTVHLSCDIDQYFLPVKWIIFHCIDIPCFISPLIIWWVVQLFNLYFTSAVNNGSIHICGQGLCKDKYRMFLDVWLGADLLGYLTTQYDIQPLEKFADCFAFCKTTTSFLYSL